MNKTASLATTSVVLVIVGLIIFFSVRSGYKGVTAVSKTKGGEQAIEKVMDTAGKQFKTMMAKSSIPSLSQPTQMAAAFGVSKNSSMMGLILLVGVLLLWIDYKLKQSSEDKQPQK